MNTYLSLPRFDPKLSFTCTKRQLDVNLKHDLRWWRLILTHPSAASLFVVAQRDDGVSFFAMKWRRTVPTTSDKKRVRVREREKLTIYNRWRMNAIVAVFVSSPAFYKCRAAIKTLDGLAADLACRDSEFYSGELKPSTRAQWINWMLSSPFSVHLWSAGSSLTPTMAFRSSRHYPQFMRTCHFSFLLFSLFIFEICARLLCETS